MLKVALLLIFGAVLVQSCGRVRRRDEQQSLQGNPSDDLSKLKQKVDDAIKEGKAKVDAAGKNLLAQSNAKLSDIKKVMESDSKTLVEELQGLKDRAKALSLNIDDCLKGKEAEVKGLLATHSQAAELCHTNGVKELEASIKASEEAVQQSGGDVADLQAELTKCGSDSACKTKVGKKITLAIVNLPTQVGEGASNTVRQMERLSGAVRTCLQRNIQKDGLGILVDIGRCVSKKIKPAPL